MTKLKVASRSFSNAPEKKIRFKRENVLHICILSIRSNATEFAAENVQVQHT